MQKTITRLLPLVISMSLQNVYADSNDLEADHGNRFNLKVAPISALVGITNVELDVVLNEHYTIGPSYAGFDFDHSDVDYDADAFGVRVNYYFNRSLSGGWLIGVSALYGDFEISQEKDGITYTNTLATRAYTALFSYQAMWDHFNMTFGIGASYFSLPSSVTAVEGFDVLTIDTSFISGMSPNAEITLGWRF